MRADDEDDDEAERHREIAEEYRWREGEREQLAAESAERQARIKRDEVLQWCAERAEAREAKVARRDNGPTDELGRPLNDRRYRLDPDATPASRFVSRKELIDELDYLAAIIATVTKEKREEALAPLREEIAALRAEVAELRVAALRRTETSTDAEVRKRAGEIRRAQQQAARLRVA